MANPKGAGRKLGTKNGPDAVSELIEGLYPMKKTRNKAFDKQNFHGTKQVTIPFDIVSHTILRLHAIRRGGMPLSTLVLDILNAWIDHSTDYDQAIFKEVLPRNARAPKNPERFPGYIQSLGFTPSPDPTPPTPTPQPTPEAFRQGETLFAPQAANVYPDVASVPLATAPTLADMTAPYRHPSTQGPGSYPHPAPTLPANANLFDPVAHAAAAPVSGQGSAAQDLQMGRPPQAELPPLNTELQQYIDFYRVKPEDIR